MKARKANKIYVLCNISQQYFWTVIQSNTDYNKTKHNIENIYIKHDLMYEKFELGENLCNLARGRSEHQVDKIINMDKAELYGRK